MLVFAQVLQQLSIEVEQNLLLRWFIKCNMWLKYNVEGKTTILKKNWGDKHMRPIEVFVENLILDNFWLKYFFVMIGNFGSI